MEIKEIQELVKMFDKSNLGEFILEGSDYKLTLKTKEKETVIAQMQYQTVAPAPVATAPAMPAAAPAAAPAPASAPAAAVGGTIFKSPMIGTYYRSPGPGKDPFVKPADKVKKGQVLCVIEAMKLFNEIEAETDGTIVKVIADDASPVEYDQPLFIIE